MATETDWPKAQATYNAVALAGYLAGALGRGGGWRKDGDIYAVDELANPLVIVHRGNGNRFRVTVEQIGGIE